MSEFDTSDLISFLAVLVSLVAVIVGPFVTVKIAKMQINAPIRQKWMEELKELISEYLCECEKLIILGEDGIFNTSNIDQVTFKRLILLQQKLRLMLDPNEIKHVKLLELIESITEEVYYGAKDLISFGGQLKRTITTVQQILRDEWIIEKNCKL